MPEELRTRQLILNWSGCSLSFCLPRLFWACDVILVTERPQGALGITCSAAGCTPVSRQLLRPIVSVPHRESHWGFWCLVLSRGGSLTILLLGLPSLACLGVAFKTVVLLLGNDGSGQAELDCTRVDSLLGSARLWIEGSRVILVVRLPIACSFPGTPQRTLQ